MKGLTIEYITEAVDGIYYGPSSILDREIDGVVIDSRLIKKDYLFVPIKGSRVDGHDYIPNVMESGALCSLSEKVLENIDFPYILVKDSKIALKALAAYYRRQLSATIIGVTGSVGKTSTKEMIASILSQKYSVLKTAGNFNNEIGLPLTIFQIREEHDVAVLEMGISGFDEMHRLAHMAMPNIGVITNIGHCHLENLGDLDGVLKAKTEMFEHLAPNASVVLNGDDRKLATISKVQGSTPYFFGMNPSDKEISYADQVEDLGMEGSTCTLHIGKTSIPVHIPIPGIHMVYNALAGAIIGTLLSLTPTEIQEGVASLKPVSGRNNRIKTESLTILDDCYNANPVSMKASLDVLSGVSGRKVAILGDMFELGVQEKILHKEVGAYAFQNKIDVLCCIGKLAKEIQEGALAANLLNQLPTAKMDSKKHLLTTHYFQSKKDFLKDMPMIFEKGDTVLVKASHGMEFPELVDALNKLSL